jgi:hypothetical protein
MPSPSAKAPPPELTFDFAEQDDYFVARSAEEPGLIAVEKSVDELEVFLPKAVKGFMKRHDRGDVDARIKRRTASQLVVAIRPLTR